MKEYEKMGGKELSEALLSAAGNGESAEVEKLLNLSAEIGDEVFSAAIESDNSAILSILIGKAEDSGRGPDPQVLLSEAVGCGAFDSAALILERYDWMSEAAAMELESTSDPRMGELLLGYGADTHGSDYIMDPLLDAVRNGNRKYAELLISSYEQYLEIPLSDDDQSEISEAIENRDAETVEDILNRHESADAEDRYSRTELR